LQSGERKLSSAVAAAGQDALQGDAMTEYMSTLTDATAITDKTRELCQTILDHPAFKSAQERIQTFTANDAARTQYESVVGKSQELRHKQQHGESLSDEEVAAFEKERDSLMRDPVARDFIDAQSDLHELRHTIEQHVALTLELGRVPTEEDIEAQSCGSGCGCHHH
jgi:cell fate (sporulation/competence/biofilm development) regulator YlbF (YheA/YmcA/DUF963 family)